VGASPLATPAKSAAARGRRLERGLGVLTLVALLVALETAVRLAWINPAFVPAPTVVVQKLWDLFARGAVLAPLLQTLGLLFTAYVASTLLAVGTGLLMGRFKAVHGLLEPLVEVLRPLPKPALLPPLILFLGLGSPMKLAVVGLGVFFPILINTVQGVRGTDPVLLDMARTFGHGPRRQLLRVILPSALPMILAGMRISLGLGLVLVVIAEMLAGTGGVGYLIIDMQRSFRVAEMYAWIVILAVLGFALNELFVRLERRAIHWSLVSRT
jgi:ABC-type nitrate/sulfonate/bicarbonate transport system permease component